MKAWFLLGRFGFSVVLLGVLCALAGCNKAEKAELEQLRAEHTELEKLREENAKLTEAQASNAEVVRLKKENEEVHKLRGEVRQLRDQAQQLTKVAEESKAQKAAGNAAAATQVNLSQENENLRAQIAQLVRQLAQGNAPGAAAAGPGACINNLRQIFAATEQWAAENKKPAGTPILPAEIAQISNYLPGNRLPVCPQGGNYSFQAVGVPPTCNIPGHVM